jgi:hypothetical protein
MEKIIFWNFLKVGTTTTTGKSLETLSTIGTLPTIGALSWKTSIYQSAISTKRTQKGF